MTGREFAAALVAGQYITYFCRESALPLPTEIVPLDIHGYAGFVVRWDGDTLVDLGMKTLGIAERDRVVALEQEAVDHLSQLAGVSYVLIDKRDLWCPRGVREEEQKTYMKRECSTMKVMNLFGGQKAFQLSEDLCHKVAEIINKGEGVESNYSRMTDGSGIRMYLVSQDGKTCWEMSTATGSLTITSTRLRNKGQGTYTKVMQLLMDAVKGSGTVIVIKDVQDPGTIEWCHNHKFVQEASSDDFIYFL